MTAGVSEFLSVLNDQQRRAVEHSGGPLIVLAGPGTGKTRVIIARIAHLLEEGAAPESLLAVTFTVKAADEMRARLVDLVGRRRAEDVRIGTFHGIGRQWLARFGDMIGLRREPMLLDSAQSKRLALRIIEQHELFPSYAGLGRESAIDELWNFIGQCRASARFPEDAVRYADEWRERLDAGSESLSGDDLIAEEARCIRFGEFARAFQLIDEACRKEGLVTFDDFITLPIRIFREKPVAASILRSEIRHVVVDEFQDADLAQIEMLRHVAPSQPNTDLCVVGDDDQAIYAFRGAGSYSFNKFAEVWPDHTVIPLEVNYRSTPNILAAAATFVEATSDRFQPDKTIRAAAKPQSSDPELEGILTSGDTDFGAIAGVMIEQDRAESGRPFSSYAILARTNLDLERAVEQLRLMSIPTRVRRRTSVLDDPAVKDILCWVRLLVDPHDEYAAWTLLARAPFLVPHERIAVLMKDFRNLQFNASKTAVRPSDVPTVLSWLEREHAKFEPVVRMISVLEQMRDAIHTKTADVAVHQIVRLSGLIDADPIEPRDMARRIEHLASVVQFVNDITPRLDPPADLAAFWSYYQDLDEREQQFELAAHGRLDTGDEAEDDESQVDAVQLMTAHSAKGLEFDTVFIIRVRPRGFPAVERAANYEPLPEAFSGQVLPSHDSEERRLFYVAMTRAKRRLVLLAKTKKAKTTDYFLELTEENSELGAVIRKEAEILDQAGESLSEAARAAADRLITGNTDEHEKFLDSSERVVRNELFAIVHRARESQLDPTQLDELSTEARTLLSRIALIGHARRGDDAKSVPILAQLPGAEKAWYQSLLDKQVTGAAFIPPPTPPLELNYTAIDSYIRCPRCYYKRYQLKWPDATPSHLTLGSITHSALEQFYREFANASADSRPVPTIERLLSIAGEIYEQSWPRHLPRSKGDLDKINAQMRIVFEKLHDPNVQVLEVERKISKFDWPVDDVIHQMTAKIDRIDQVELPGGIGYRIIDYKSGQPWKKLLEPPADDLQMGIYAAALMAYLETDSLPPGTAEYWLIGTGERGIIDLHEINMDKVRDTVARAVKGILAGHWPKGRDCRGDCDMLGFLDSVSADD